MQVTMKSQNYWVTDQPKTDEEMPYYNWERPPGAGPSQISLVKLERR